MSVSGNRPTGVSRASDAFPTLALHAVAGFALLACGGGSSEPPAPPAGAIPAGQTIGSAAIAGRVVFEGAPAPRKPVRMSGEASCHKPGDPEALSEDLLVASDGGVRNAWVRVVSGLGDRVFAPPSQPVEVDQAGCVFLPHVVVAQTNQVILFKNSDPVVHNVRSMAQSNATFNISLSGRGRSARRFFSKPEAVRIKCDLHAWMGGYVLVHENPFQAVSGEDGAFSLAGLPAGTYEVEAWHETLGASRQSVTLADGERKELTFTFRKGS